MTAEECKNSQFEDSLQSAFIEQPAVTVGEQHSGDSASKMVTRCYGPLFNPCLYLQSTLCPSSTPAQPLRSFYISSLVFFFSFFLSLLILNSIQPLSFWPLHLFNSSSSSLILSTFVYTATMSARPQNIGIKAIEVYFPSQVCILRMPLEMNVLIKTVCRPGWARKVRWREWGQIHHWSWPDQDELLWWPWRCVQEASRNWW